MKRYDKSDMTNIAHTQEYLQSRMLYESLCIPACLANTRSYDIGYGYSASELEYNNLLDDEEEPFRCCYDRSVSDKDNQHKYSWRTAGDGIMCRVIRHVDMNHYLLHNWDATGYSVTNLSNDQVFHYVPKEKDSFLWVQPHYNPVSSLLAVEGFLRHRPWHVIVTDFSNPFAQERWVDLSEELGIEDSVLLFERWDWDDLIVIHRPQEEGSAERKVRVTKDMLNSWFRSR